MYSPPYNRVEDRKELVAFMRANNFALLVTATGGVPLASHLPVTVADGADGVVIQSHMAKPNAQWKGRRTGMSDRVDMAFVTAANAGREATILAGQALQRSGRLNEIAAAVSWSRATTMRRSSPVRRSTSAAAGR